MDRTESRVEVPAVGWSAPFVRRADLWTWVLWGVFSLLVVGAAWNSETAAGVPSIYREAADDWLAGRKLYDGSGEGFIYLPQSAVFYIPFTWLPVKLSAAAWRIVNIGVFAWGVWRLSSVAARQHSVTFFPLASLISVLLAWSAARHGQMTMVMGGAMMLAAADLADRRWWRAAIWLTVGLAFKPLIVVMMLLAAALYRSVSWRLLICFVCVCLVPFLTQSPGYVIDQYGQSAQALVDAFRLGLNNQWAQIFGMLQSFGIHAPDPVPTVIRVVVALVTLGLCWSVQKRHGRDRALVGVWTLAVCYLLLFNPRTERNTYALIGSAIGIFAAHALLVDRRTVLAGVSFALVGLSLLSHPLSKLVSAQPTLWVKPLLCIVFLCLALRELFAGESESEVSVDPG